MRPSRSYTVWFSQRTGSTLLCSALEATGVAGKPAELFTVETGTDLLAHFGAETPEALQRKIWALGSTPNGVFGLKQGFWEPHVSYLIDVFRTFSNRTGQSRAEVWEDTFPDGRHIFMTRRNKVRLAVSWWKAIQSEEWHRRRGDAPSSKDIDDAYNFAALDHLLSESVLREAGMQAFFTDADIVPFTVFYEDFIANYAGTVAGILEHLEIELPQGHTFAPPKLEPLADDLSERWVQRFREEKQRNWQNFGW